MLLRKKKRMRQKLTSVSMLLLVLLLFGAVQPPKVEAAASSAKSEVSESLPLNANGKEDIVGRYQYNYTGNWNYNSEYIVNEAQRGMRSMSSVKKR